jgi:hypothetical protein
MILGVFFKQNTLETKFGGENNLVGKNTVEKFPYIFHHDGKFPIHFPAIFYHFYQNFDGKLLENFLSKFFPKLFSPRVQSGNSNILVVFE